MDEKTMIDDLIHMLDKSITKGVGHINVHTEEEGIKSKDVRTLGCSDCSRTPLKRSVPSSTTGMSDFQ